MAANILKVTWLAIIAAILYLRIRIVRVFRWALNLPEPTIRVTPWRVVRVYIIRESVPEAYEWDFKNITDYEIDYSRKDWKDCVQELVPAHWPDWRLELRCRKGALKKRIVVRSDEEMRFPLECKGSPRRRTMEGRGMLLGAILATPSGEYLDITNRVKKYVISPGRVLRPRDIFPLDDVVSLCKHNEYIRIRVLYIDGTSKTITCHFDDETVDISKFFY